MDVVRVPHFGYWVDVDGVTGMLGAGAVRAYPFNSSPHQYLVPPSHPNFDDHCTMREYKHLTPEEREHFIIHGWLHVRGAIKEKYMDEWMSDLWVRLDYDPHDKSTWKEAYTKLPRHREVLASEFCPEAWEKMVELVGGEDVIDPVRERYFGDQFICNFGSEERAKASPEDDVQPKDMTGWHTDDDWYRLFADSSGNALTIINCFTDIPARGGGTQVCEDGIAGLCKQLYDHPEGLDPPFKGLYDHVKQCKQFTTVEAKAGDVFITHSFLPHTASPNYLHYPRIITNPHVNMCVPFNLNRPDGDYTPCEQVILYALNRESIPEYIPTRERTTFYPRTAFFKREKVKQELDRMIAHAKSQGLDEGSVDSIYLKGEEAIREHEKRNGYDKPWGPSGVERFMGDKTFFTPPTSRHEVV